MAVTLNDLAMVSTNPLAKAVILDLLRQSKILQLVPIESVSALKATAVRWQTLPSVSTRALNGTYTESTGQLEQVPETLHIYGGEINVDRVATLDKSLVEDPMTTQTKMKVAAMAYKFNYDFVRGDHAVDPLGFEGLQKRVSNLPARMYIRASGTTDTLKILADAASEHAFVDKLHELVHVTGANALLMNETVFLAIGRVLRRLNLLSQNQDNYGRVWTEFAGAKLVDVGLKADQTTEIIPLNETAEDAGTDSTSIYGVRFDGEDGFRIIQLNGTSTDPYDPIGGEMQTKPARMRRIDWVIGLQNMGRYAIGRLYNFTPAAA